MLKLSDNAGGLLPGGGAAQGVEGPAGPHGGLGGVFALPFGIFGELDLRGDIHAGHSGEPALPNGRGFGPAAQAFL